MYRASMFNVSTRNGFRDRVSYRITDTRHMLLLMAAMFLMPGKVHVLRKDTMNRSLPPKTQHSCSFRKSLIVIMDYPP
jgi:hypothetical protein